jgi:stage III sporulation protein SpoIIIAA
VGGLETKKLYEKGTPVEVSPPDCQKTTLLKDAKEGRSLENRATYRRCGYLDALGSVMLIITAN